MKTVGAPPFSPSSSSSFYQRGILFFLLSWGALAHCAYATECPGTPPPANPPENLIYCTSDNYPPLTYDWQNSSQEIARGGDGTVSVTGGIYEPDKLLRWAITGEGFTFADGTTSVEGGKTQVVVAAADACGSAEITVSDTCGHSAEGNGQRQDVVLCDRLPGQP